jgi:predicted enzyme related to lactoylglutathione lyase
MNNGAQTLIYPTKDLAATKAAFTALFGTGPVVDEPYYVQFQAGGQTVGIDPNGHDKGLPGPVAYWHVDDIEAAFERLKANGTVVEDLRDVGGGRLIASVAEPNGNVIGLLQDPAS